MDFSERIIRETAFRVHTQFSASSPPVTKSPLTTKSAGGGTNTACLPALMTCIKLGPPRPSILPPCPKLVHFLYHFTPSSLSLTHFSTFRSRMCSHLCTPITRTLTRLFVFAFLSPAPVALQMPYVPQSRIQRVPNFSRTYTKFLHRRPSSKFFLTSHQRGIFEITNTLTRQ